MRAGTHFIFLFPEAKIDLIIEDASKISRTVEGATVKRSKNKVFIYNKL